MSKEGGRQFGNGEVLKPKEVADLVMTQEALSAISLVTMTYAVSPDDPSTSGIHRKLLDLANSGTDVRLSVEHRYAKKLAPEGDVPAWMAPILGQSSMQQHIRGSYRELEEAENAQVIYNGADEKSLNPFSKIDHRKWLLMSSQAVPDSGVVFGFNVTPRHFGPHLIDSGVFIKDQDALHWLESQQKTPHVTQPVAEKIGDFSFVTRELTEDGNTLANDRIRETTEGAKNRLTFIGQFMPDGELFESLVDTASRGVRIDVVSNYPSIEQQPIYALLRLALVKKLGRAAQKSGNIHFYAPVDPRDEIHMKGLLRDIDNPHNSTVLTGNDNMTNKRLQQWGTREVLMELNNRDHQVGFASFVGENVMPRVAEFDPNAIHLGNMIRSAARRQKVVSR
jgi:hypothetical protein